MKATQIKKVNFVVMFIFSHYISLELHCELLERQQIFFEIKFRVVDGAAEYKFFKIRRK